MKSFSNCLDNNFRVVLKFTTIASERRYVGLRPVLGNGRVIIINLYYPYTYMYIRVIMKEYAKPKGAQYSSL